MTTQIRPTLAQTVQQYNATPMGAVVSDQIEEFSTTGTMSTEKDLAVCDATAGTFTLTLPGSDVYIGKHYNVVETSGVALVTVDAAGAGTIDGSATVVCPAGESITVVPIEIDATTRLVTWRVLSQTAAAGGDATAIHVNVANEITGITLKAVPVLADEYVQEDSAAAFVKKSTTLGAMLGAVGQVTNLAAATPLAADKLAFEDASDSLAMKETTIGELPIAQAQVTGILLQPAADAAVTILGTTRAIVLTVTAAATVVIADGAGLYPGQVVSLRAAAVSGGGSYTLAVEGGTLTINATGEEPAVMRNEANDAWVVIRLGTATIV